MVSARALSLVFISFPVPVLCLASHPQHILWERKPGLKQGLCGHIKQWLFVVNKDRAACLGPPVLSPSLCLSVKHHIHTHTYTLTHTLSCSFSVASRPLDFVQIACPYATSPNCLSNKFTLAFSFICMHKPTSLPNKEKRMEINQKAELSVANMCESTKRNIKTS